MEVKTVKNIYNDQKNYIIAHNDRLTDFNDGSVLMSYVEAGSREIGQLYIEALVGFTTFLRELPYSVFGLRPKDGVKASTKIVLSRSKPFPYETSIPAGTIVSAGGLNFITTESVIVGANEKDSPSVLVTAEKIGDKYNVPKGAIKTIVSTLSADIVKAENQESAEGGKESEDWTSFINRFGEYILGLQRTNGSGLRTGLKDLIRSMGIEEHFPPLDIWNMTFYLEDGSGSMSPQDLAEAKRIIDGNIVKGVHGYRSPGISIRYLPPEIIPVTVHVTVKKNKDIASDDLNDIKNEVINEVKKYINGLIIGESVQRSDLTVLLKRLSTVRDVEITFPTANIEIDPNSQIARYFDCIVTVAQ
jgi:hypothetical protein